MNFYGLCGLERVGMAKETAWLSGGMERKGYLARIIALEWCNTFNSRAGFHFG